MGFDQGFAALPTLLYPNYVCVMGVVEQRPVVEEGRIVVRTMMSPVFTCDHRFGDGATVKEFFKVMKEFIEDPETFLRKEAAFS